ncbi:hypothetical protein V5O48_011360 [Marasmius crinis-equi]|uniref:Uncharacterized protein n=1 Tax=Marasmius crinis-equi TaxID=585013 RepID=A0ABR3F5U3_9AGAR
MEVNFSQSLLRRYPSLQQILESLNNTTPDSGDDRYDFEVFSCAGPLPPFKTVSWSAVHGLGAVLWLDDFEAIAHGRSSDTLSDLIIAFRAAHGQKHAYDQTWIILHNPAPSTAETFLDVVKTIEYPPNLSLTIAQTVEEAAAAIHSFTCTLADTIENPSPEMKMDTFRRMIMLIPGMNDARARLVTGRYRSFAELGKDLRGKQEEIESGRILLNTSLFSDDVPLNAPAERWIYNLFRQLVTDDPHEILYYDSDDPEGY